jgi:hypothetical protein
MGAKNVFIVLIHKSYGILLVDTWEPGRMVGGYKGYLMALFQLQWLYSFKLMGTLMNGEQTRI